MSASPFARAPTDKEKAAAEAIFESCPFKTVASGTLGFGFGALFGLVLAGIETNSAATVDTNAPMKAQIRQTLKDMAARSKSNAKGFAMVGAIYSGSECVIESYRAKNDIYNSVSAGCFTGAVLARKGGPQAAALGCVGFGAFSILIDYYFKYSS
ncbi:mitochondrial import inner membrane translocase, subunit Tim17/22 [Ramicandelaber brevisporus]|nr:mitochondrial import inner membrane translocase, subunit Tim17/22 [Ramicandelaber brevisporus]